MIKELWHDWTYDGRGWYLANDPEITFYSEDEANAYCDEHNRAIIGQAAIEERKRIADIINGRINIHTSFVNHCMDNDVAPSPNLFSALAELRSLLREIEHD